MGSPNNIDIIEIKWDGPFDVQDVRKMKGPRDYGLYQIYGPHSVYGSDTLLYLGKANNLTFASRFNAHEKWTDDEQAPVDVYIGKLGGVSQLSDREWGRKINQAEALLLEFATPPYNKKSEKIQAKSTIVMSFYKCNKLPLIVSNLWLDSSIWVKDSSRWDEYMLRGNKKILNLKKKK